MGYVRVVAGFADLRGPPAPGDHVDQILIRIVLQTAVSGRLADGTVERMVGEEQFEHELAQLDDLVRVGLHLHAFADLGPAGGHGPARPFDLHQAQTAGPVRFKARIVAQRGDVDPGLAGHFQDGLTRTGLHLLSVQSEIDHFYAGRLGRGGHHDLLTASNRHLSKQAPHLMHSS